MKSVSIFFEYEENEYINADRRYLSISGRLTKIKMASALALIALSIISARVEGYEIPAYICLALTVWWCIKMAFRYFVKPQSDFKSKSKNAKTFSFTFTKDKIAFSTQRASAEFQWRMFKKLFETNDMIYLAHANKSVTIIPKRAFTDEEQLAAFRKIVGQGNSTMEYIRID